MSATKPRQQRDAINAAEEQHRQLHITDPDNYGPLGSMVLVYCRSCGAQPMCDARGCVKLQRRTAQ